MEPTPETPLPRLGSLKDAAKELGLLDKYRTARLLLAAGIQHVGSDKHGAIWNLDEIQANIEKIKAPLQFIPVAQAATILGLSRQWCYNMIRQGKLNAVKDDDGTVRLDVKDVYAIADARRQQLLRKAEIAKVQEDARYLGL